jgi:hypothetical protein
MAQLMSPFIDVNSKISSVGSQVFEIQRKIYADSHVIKKPAKPAINAVRASTMFTVSRGSLGESISGLPPTFAAAQHQQSLSLSNSAPPPLAAMIASFTDATANAYQEWNVVKKNKFGRRQERIFGVDGRIVYNAKRGALRGGGNQGSVYRAKRDIAAIVKIEILSEDATHGGGVVSIGATVESHASRTFRITWADNNDIYNIEYTTDTSRECVEIVAKVKYLLNRLKHAGGR